MTCAYFSTGLVQPPNDQNNLVQIKKNTQKHQHPAPANSPGTKKTQMFCFGATPVPPHSRGGTWNPPRVPEFLSNGCLLPWVWIGAMVTYATYDSSCCPQYLGESEKADFGEG